MKNGETEKEILKKVKEKGGGREYESVKRGVRE